MPVIIVEIKNTHVLLGFNPQELQNIFPPTSKDMDVQTSKRINFGITKFEKITGKLGWWVAAIVSGTRIFKGSTIVRMTSLAKPIRPKPR